MRKQSVVMYFGKINKHASFAKVALSRSGAQVANALKDGLMVVGMDQ